MAVRPAATQATAACARAKYAASCRLPIAISAGRSARLGKPEPAAHRQQQSDSEAGQHRDVPRRTTAASRRHPAPPWSAARRWTAAPPSPPVPAMPSVTGLVRSRQSGRRVVLKRQRGLTRACSHLRRQPAPSPPALGAAERQGEVPARVPDVMPHRVRTYGGIMEPSLRPLPVRHGGEERDEIGWTEGGKERLLWRTPPRHRIVTGEAPAQRPSEWTLWMPRGLLSVSV